MLINVVELRNNANLANINMKNFIKENWFKLVIIAVMALFFSFYWIEIRPVLARRSCSWVVKAMPADFGVTKEKAEENRKAFEQCKKIMATRQILPFLSIKNTIIGSMNIFPWIILLIIVGIIIII